MNMQEYVKEILNLGDGTPWNANSTFDNGAYRGAGKYWVAVKQGRIIASIQMGECPLDENFTTFREEARKLLATYGIVISGDGSGGSFFCKNPSDLIHFNNHKVYDVPSAQGGLHTNFETNP